MTTYAAASAEIAMYESLAIAASLTGDEDTVTLARTLQDEEKEDYRLAWDHLAMAPEPCALPAMSAST